MHTYLQKVQEKHFKYLLINFSKKPQGTILISYFYVFRKSREEITQKPQVHISCYMWRKITNRCCTLHMFCYECH